MTTVAQLREFLAKFPDDTEVEVVEVKSGYWEQWGEEVALDVQDYGNWEYYEFTEKPNVLVLGET